MCVVFIATCVFVSCMHSYFPRMHVCIPGEHICRPSLPYDPCLQQKLIIEIKIIANQAHLSTPTNQGSCTNTESPITLSHFPRSKIPSTNTITNTANTNDTVTNKSHIQEKSTKRYIPNCFPHILHEKP